MSLSVSCPSCGKSLRIPDEAKGRRVRCRECQHTFAAGDADAPLPVGPAPEGEPPRGGLLPPEVKKIVGGVGLLCGGLLVLLILGAAIAALGGKRELDAPPQVIVEANQRPAQEQPPKQNEPQLIKMVGDHSARVGDFLLVVGNPSLDFPPLRGKASGERYMDREWSLLIPLAVGNATQTKKLVYPGFLRGTKPTLEDNFGNRYALTTWSGPAVEVMGRVEAPVSVHPGKGQEVNDVIVFEQPLKNLESLTLTLPAKPFGERGELKFVIPKSAIKGL